MRYTLWSHGQLVGHTDLDIHTVTPTMRQGFVDPTADGKALLADATGVWRALAEVKRESRVRGETGVNDVAVVSEAVRRREDLDLKMRDENGTLFDCDFIRIYDLFDINGGIVDEMGETEEEEEAAFQIRLSALSGEAREEALARRAEMDAEIDAMVAELREEGAEQSMYGSAWPPPPPEDPRWNTMQYLMQVFVKGSDWEE